MQCSKLIRCARGVLGLPGEQGVFSVVDMWVEARRVSGALLQEPFPGKREYYPEFFKIYNGDHLITIFFVVAEEVN